VVNLRKQLLLSFFVTGLLIAPAWARPIPAAISNHSQQSPTQPAPAATGSASGKIVAATDAMISLEVQQGSDPQTQQFVINSDTTIDGKLAVGASATVEFRTDGGNQIATHITVQAGS
jgi:hypothetical protein